MGAALRKMREKRAGEASPFPHSEALSRALKQAGGHFAAGGIGVGGVLGERKCHESLQRGDPEIHL